VDRTYIPLNRGRSAAYAVSGTSVATADHRPLRRLFGKVAGLVKVGKFISRVALLSLTSRGPGLEVFRSHLFWDAYPLGQAQGE
jgi:hypothetical protein